MSGDDRKGVHQQNNGARIVVQQTSSEPVWQESDFDDAPSSRSGGFRRRSHEANRSGGFPSEKGRPVGAFARKQKRGVFKKRRRGAKSSGAVVAGAVAGWTKPLMLIASAAFFIAFTITLFETFTGFTLRIIIIGAGALMGMVVKIADPPGKLESRRLAALLFTYLCIAGTYVYPFYDYVAHPEKYEIVGFDDMSVAEMYGYAEAPEEQYNPTPRPSGPVTVQSFDNPGGGGGFDIGFNLGAFLYAIGMSLALPLTLLTNGALLEFVWVILAMGAAWKTVE